MLLVRIFFLILVLGPLVLGTAHFFRNRGTQLEPRKTYVPTLVNSAVLYAIAFNVIFFLQELFLVLGKKFLGLTAYLYHNNHRWEGSHPMETLFQGSGALAIFLIGLILLAVFKDIRNSESIWKVLVLWLAFNGLIQSVPQVMVAFFDKNTDVGQAFVGYLALNDSALASLAIVSIVLTIFVSILFARLILGIAPSDAALTSPKARINFVTYAGAGAAFLGSALVIPFRVPPATQMIAPFLLWLFAIPWMWSAAGLMKNVQRVRNETNEKVRWEPFVILVFLLVVFRILLAPGIRF